MFRIPRKKRPADALAAERLSQALALLDRHLGDRITLRQARAFLSIAQFDRAGEELNLAELNRAVGGIPYRSIMRFGDDGLRLIDVEADTRGDRGRIVSLNNRGRRLAGVVVEEIMGGDAVAERDAEIRADVKAKSVRRR